MCPQPESPSHVPPRTIALGHPSAPAPSILYHASNLDWWFISYLKLYMFQCHSPKSSHPFPLPQSPKDCSIICVSFAVSHTGLSFSSVQLSSVAQSYLTLCNPMNHSTPGLPVTNSRSSLRLTSIDSVMPPSHLILGLPLLLLPPIPPSIRVFSNESTLRMRWPKYWSFIFSIIPSKEIPGLISFRMDWLDLLAVQGTLKSLL